MYTLVGKLQDTCVITLKPEFFTFKTQLIWNPFLQVTKITELGEKRLFLEHLSMDILLNRAEENKVCATFIVSLKVRIS